MNKNEKGNSILESLAWKFGERIAAQSVTFLVSLVIARILQPQAYGIISIVMVFISFADTFVVSGFGNALIQKKESDEVDFSSVFYFNIGFSLMVYMIIFLLAPYIEKWYGNNYEGLTEVLRVLALRIPISAINNVQQSYVSKNMIFKKFFFATLIGTIGAAIGGIILAYNGWGVWALVFQYLFNAIVDTVILWITVRWRPKALFSFNRLAALIRYGWKLMVGALLETLYNNMRTILIGKNYTSSQLAYYDRGKQLPGLAVDNVNTSILSVMFPAICIIQDDIQKIKILVKRAVRISSYVISPILVGLAVTANKIILILLTEKWLPAVWFVRAFCIIYLLQPITKPMQQVIKARGRSDITLVLQIVTKIIGIIGVVLAMPIGVKAIAIAYAITVLIGSVLDMNVSGYMIQYSFKEQVRDILPSLCLSAIMGLAVFEVGKLLVFFNMYCALLLQILSGILVYLILSVLFYKEALIELLSIVQRFIKRAR